MPSIVSKKPLKQLKRNAMKTKTADLSATTHLLVFGAGFAAIVAAFVTIAGTYVPA